MISGPYFVVVVRVDALMFRLCVRWMCVIVWTDGWLDPVVDGQSERAFGGSEGPGGAGSTCEPGHGGLPVSASGRLLGVLVGAYFHNSGLCKSALFWGAGMRGYRVVYAVWWRARQVART
jgi:hypothetical protein